ncbi:bifunctional hydroxymethylpyrimidine kinase/phosphomethylpyrimidine kinase, partial [bacterium]|nr:bifunctional hydroxymethylpyrimidine kinase/phosphomethylpyrimidine kinase [bacterium]
LLGFNMIKKVLHIAGSDPSGGAGVELGNSFFTTKSIYQFSVITIQTVQNSKGVHYGVYTTPELFKNILYSISDDFDFDFILLGIIANSELIDVFLNWYKSLNKKTPIGFDPVLKSSSKYDFYSEDSILNKTGELLPYLEFITPNIYEAKLLTSTILDKNSKIKNDNLKNMGYYIDKLVDLGAKRGVITGGDIDSDKATDFAFEILNGKTINVKKFETEKIKLTKEIHGTGTLFSSLLSYYLMSNYSFFEAVEKSKNDILNYIKYSKFTPGSGYYYFHFTNIKDLN